MAKMLSKSAQGRDPFARLPWPVGRVTALYAQIPFCRSRCAYCGFISRRQHSESDRDGYLELLRHEADYLARRGLFAGRTASMLFVGGGTPTVLSPAQLRRLTRWLTGLLPLEPDFEFTCEGHPRTLLGKEGQERLVALVEGGVNRVSLGVQDFVPAVLRACNRRHTRGEVREALQRTRAAGVRNVNLDFIFGLPAQTPESWRKTLGQAIDLHPETLTAYRLRLKPGTPMALRSADEFPDEDACARMRESTLETLARAGYVHMLSNQFALAGYMFYDQFALPGCNYRYEVDNFLPTRDTIGMGVAAYSVLEDRAHFNFRSRDDYDAAAARSQCVVQTFGRLSKDYQPARMLVVGLRRPSAGVGKAEFRAHFGRDLVHHYRSIVGKLVRQRLVASSADRLRLTEKGLRSADAINEICAPLYARLIGRGRATRLNRTRE